MVVCRLHADGKTRGPGLTQALDEVGGEGVRVRLTGNLLQAAATSDDLRDEPWQVLPQKRRRASAKIGGGSTRKHTC